MEKIYEQAKDLHVSATIFYTSNNREPAYIDPGLKVKATRKEVIDAFVKGTMVISRDGHIYKPIDLGLSEEYVTAMYLTHIFGSDGNPQVQYVIAGEMPPDQ